MQPLTQVRMTALNPVLISSKQPQEYFKNHPEMGILRLDRSTFWVFDRSSQLGILVSGWDTAKSLFLELTATEF